MAVRSIQMTSARVRVMALPATLAFAALAAAPAMAAAPRAQANAVGPPGAVLRHGAPGRVLRGSVSVDNLSGKRISVRLQRADIANASNGNADYLTAGVRRTGRWLRLQTATVHLAPHA